MQPHRAELPTPEKLEENSIGIIVLLIPILSDFKGGVWRYCPSREGAVNSAPQLQGHGPNHRGGGREVDVVMAVDSGLHLGLHRGGGTCPSFCASFGTPIDPCRVELMMRRCCGCSWLDSPTKQARAARWNHQRTSRGSVEGLSLSPLQGSILQPVKIAARLNAAISTVSYCGS